MDDMRGIPLKQSQGFFWVNLSLLVLIAGFMMFFYPLTGWDQALIAPYYSKAAQIFPLRNSAFMQNFMHTGLKDVTIVVALLVLAVFLFSFKVAKLAPYRRQAGWILVGMVLADSAVSVLKQESIHACPWDLVQYGGTLPWLPLFAGLPVGIAPGHCFPAGHASAGFGLMAFYFGLRDKQPFYARAALCFGLTLGFVMGWGQMMRGAHFLSHTIWSAWVVWVVLFFLYFFWSPVGAKTKVQIQVQKQPNFS